jgi:hypothetical protein
VRRLPEVVCLNRLLAQQDVERAHLLEIYRALEASRPNNRLLAQLEVNGAAVRAQLASGTVNSHASRETSISTGGTKRELAGGMRPSGQQHQEGLNIPRIPLIPAKAQQPIDLRPNPPREVAP